MKSSDSLDRGALAIGIVTAFLLLIAMAALVGIGYWWGS
jgi:hypothetical protein